MNIPNGSKILVSVIMPTFNQADYIHEAIASVLKQTHTNLELIIIDNYSTDQTQKVINSFSDPRIHYYQFNNQGVIASSRNYAAEKAQGELLAFIDSDDVWKSQKLEKQLFHINNEEIACVSTSFEPIGHIRESGHYLRSILKGGYIDVGYDDVVLENPIITSSTLLCKDIFKKVGGFDESQNFKCIEDWELWLRLAILGKIRVLNEELVQYRTYFKPKRDLRCVQKNTLAIMDKHCNLGFLSGDLEKKARGNRYIAIGKVCLDRGDREGIHYYLKGLLASQGIRNKLKALIGLSLFVVPRFFRTQLVHKAYQFNHLLVNRASNRF